MPQYSTTAELWNASLAGDLLSALIWTWDIDNDDGYSEFSEFVAESLGISAEGFLCQEGSTDNTCAGTGIDVNTCVCGPVPLMRGTNRARIRIMAQRQTLFLRASSTYTR